MVEKVISQVRLEVSQIDELFEKYSILFQSMQKGEPDLVEVTASASILHSFYNGLENIFSCIAKRIDSATPTGDRWHRDLLDQMGKATPERNQVLTNLSIERLIDFMGFRHFYRHSYSSFLEWDELEKLVCSVEDI